ncbi:MAG: VWA domain-containing protein [Candidatus Aminicenantes bacterium]|nr:MAG: VWA domain-containing protein [Candidatus Aminicenantes bacterium]
MKKVLLFSSIIFISLALFSQQIKEEATVINIEVPVRVFSGKNFIDNLTIDDFEVLENGIPQNIEAVYFVKKRSVERKQERKRFAPKTARNFFLFFELTEYIPKIEEAITHFVHNVLTPGDNLCIVTSMKTYRMKNIAFEVSSREEIAKQLIKIVRRDTLTGNSEYRSMIDEMTVLAQTLTSFLSQERVTAEIIEDSRVSHIVAPMSEMTFAGHPESRSFEEQLIRYENQMNKLDDLRRVSQDSLMNFANYLGQKEGQKYVTIFYQEEFIPRVDHKLMNQAMSRYQSRPIILQMISNIVDFYKREIPIDTNLIKQTYADCSISIHFLYLTRPKENILGVYMEDHSEDIFSAFREMAVATGGFIDSSARADTLFKAAVEASENYYLLYYSPNKYETDGKFRNIDVKVKNKDYRIFHRAGYFAN